MNRIGTLKKKKQNWQILSQTKRKTGKQINKIRDENRAI